MADSFHRLKEALADRYALERELGAGGMATVYLAHDPRHNRKVAIKVMNPELAAIIGAARFLKEIETTANLQHPNILPLFDSGQVDATVFYVMPFVQGESLRSRLTREVQLPVADAVRIAVEVAGALDYAHRHGVIHRDIKPDNVLLHDGRPLVADFGIALVWVFQVGRAGGLRLTAEGGRDFGPEWTPDGRELIYSSAHPFFDLYRRVADASRPAEPLLTGGFDRYPGSVSPDGRLFAFSLAAPGGELWTVQLRGALAPAR